LKKGKTIRELKKMLVKTGNKIEGGEAKKGTERDRRNQRTRRSHGQGENIISV